MSNTYDGVVQLSRDPECAGVAIVTLNQPSRRNAFGLAMREQLHEVLERLMYQEPDCRAVVLTGAGAAFCSGGDITEMNDRPAQHLRERKRLPVLIFEMIADGPKPVIAAVEGPAMGAGLALAAAADDVVAAADARFCAAFVRVGLLPDTGLYWSLAQRVGAGRARELMMTAREFSGAEALNMGLADEVVESGAALAAACVRARRYLSVAPLAIAHVRATIAQGSNTFDEALEEDAYLLPLTRASQEHREGVAAFLENRSAVFVRN